MENFFVYFYSKKNPSEFLVEQRLKSNEQRAKSNEQRLKSNEQRAKSNEQREKSSASNQANKFKVKVKTFISIFYLSPFFLQSLACLNNWTIYFSISISFFFKDFSNADKERINLNAR